jgi:hypothetical protein
MSNEFDKTVNTLADAAKNTRDAVAEQVHKGKADAEREKRAEMGDTMTTGQKVESVGNEVTHEAKATYDHAKRDVRGT